MVSSKPAASTVLVVDDDDGVRLSLSDALEDAGYTVVAVSNGAAALEFLTQGSLPCVILLDLMMPVMDGWTFRAAQLSRPEWSGIPVVVLTAAGPAASRNIDAAQILAKPVALDTLLDAVQAHC